MGTTRLDISYQEEYLEKKWERKARKHRAGKESDKMQTEEIRKIGNEMQKDPASNEEYSKSDGKYKRAGRGTAKEEEGTTTVWDFWKMKTEELNVEDAPVHKDEEDSQAGRKPSNQVEGILTVIPTIRQLPDAEKEEVDVEFGRKEEECFTRFTANNEDSMRRDALPDKIVKISRAYTEERWSQ